MVEHAMIGQGPSCSGAQGLSSTHPSAGAGGEAALGSSRSAALAVNTSMDAENVPAAAARVGS